MMNYSNNDYSNLSQSTHLYREIDRKNKQISEMKKKINNLTDEKNYLEKIIQNLKNQNYNLGVSNQNENEEMDFLIQNKLNKCSETINLLQKENNVLKYQLNNNIIIEENYNKTFSNQINQSKKEIENLREMNTIKDILLRDYQDFMHQLNEIVGNKIENCELDFNNDDLNTYKNNFERIKSKVISFLNYENFHQNYIEPIKLPNNYNKNINDNNDNYYNNDENNYNNYNNNYNNNNNNLSKISKKTFSSEIIPPRPDLLLYRRDDSNSFLNKTLSKDLNQHPNNCKCSNCRYKALRNPSFISDKPPLKKKSDYSILRTPPRNDN